MTEVASYCSHCGAKIEPTSRFCSYCGRPTPLAAAKNNDDEDRRRKEEENPTTTATPTRKRREGRDLPRSYTLMTDEEYYYNYRNASDAWYLLPVFLGLLGGFIMWLALRDEDPRKAREGLYVGIVFFILGIVLLGLFGVVGRVVGGGE